MKLFNRIASVVLSLAMIFSLVTVVGVNTVKADGDFVVDTAGVLTKYTGAGGDVVLPKEVKVIGEKAFSGCGQITSIKMSDKVTTIREYAFDSCSGLTSISFSKNLKTIELGAFYGCKGLIKVDLPNKLETIGNSAFSGCNNLNGIYIPDSVKEIGTYAFGFYMSGGYTQSADFTVVGGKAAKTYATKYDFPYMTLDSLKIDPIIFRRINKTTAKFSWNKNEIIDKVQIQYSTKKNFAGKKSVTVPNREVTSKLVKGLKKNQNYYIRIRGVKVVGGTTYYSDWSKAKKIETV